MHSLRQVQRVAEPPPIETIECEECGEDCSSNELENGVCEPCIDENYTECYSRSYLSEASTQNLLLCLSLTKSEAIYLLFQTTEQLSCSS